MTVQYLPDYLEAIAARCPDRTAVVGSDGRSLTYDALNRQADALAAFLHERGVKRGDRVGVALPKTIESVVSLFGIMKAGAAYVPVDVTAPSKRGRRILTDCAIRAVVVQAEYLSVVPDVEAGMSPLSATVVVGSPNSATSNLALTGHWHSFQDVVSSRRSPERLSRSSSDLAYILYTSGSTGAPKGVMLTHENALSFVEWSSSALHPRETDRFGSHAPFHFDLSILDIYLCIKHGAELHLVSEELGKNPKELASFISARRLTFWYSTPSILTFLMQFGSLEKYDWAALRTILFAGEVFPVKHLRELQRRWPHPSYFNLYGPTETNVCTFARIPSRIPDGRDTPYPIGFPCAHCHAIVLDQGGGEVAQGAEGLLYISGPSVFPGYWNRPQESVKSFVIRDGVRWYNTGDIVRWVDGEGFVYVGRNDRMVKRRGYRIELGEIERGLYLHPKLREVAVASVSDEDAGVAIGAFLSCHDEDRPSIIELKTFCKEKLPAYMIPDRFVFLDRLPRTSTDKVDYQSLKELLPQGVHAGNVRS